MKLRNHLDNDHKRVPKSKAAANNRSTFCDYNDAFKNYDMVRQPHGLSNLLQIFGQSKVPLHKQKVLEGGFGTGAYLDNIRHHVQMIYGVEGSDEGYRQTKQKTKNARNVHLQVGDILQLPFSDNFFHAYLVNQVLHHLDIGHPFPHIDEFLMEANRVLMPGGQLTINTCSQKQLDPDSGAYWHYKYIKRAAHFMQKRFIPVKKLVERLESMGFVVIKLSILQDQIFHPRYYEDPLIALEPEFRRGDSTYSFLSAAEIDKSNFRLRAAINDDSVYEEMRRTAACVAEIGEAVIISAGKASQQS